MDYYLERRYYLHDLAFQHFVKGEESVFVWPHSKEALNRLTRQQRRVYQEAQEAGIHRGFTIPIHNVLGAASALTFSFEGTENEFDKHYAEQRDVAEQFAYAFNEAILSKHTLHFGHPHFPNLTPKELEVLKWIAMGYTYDQVATKLSIGTSTIRKHFANVLKKLQARNGQHACALAVKWGIVS